MKRHPWKVAQRPIWKTKTDRQGMVTLIGPDGQRATMSAEEFRKRKPQATITRKGKP